MSVYARLALLTLASVAIACDKTPPAPVMAARVVVTPGDTVLTAIGATVQLTARAYDAGDRVLAGRAARWSSSAPEIMRVDSTGLVVTTAPGDATISVVVDDASAQAHVRVEQVARSIEIALTQPGPLRAFGAAGRATATARDANGHPILNPDLAWSSSDASVATISATGDITALRNGSTTIRGSASGATASAVLVVDVRGSMMVTVYSIGNAVDADGYTITVGSTTVPVSRDTTVSFGPLQEGVHAVTLGGIAPHCRSMGAEQQNAPVPAGGSADVDFTVRCLGRFAYASNEPAVHYVDELGNDRSLTPGFPAGAPLKWTPDGTHLLIGAGGHIYSVGLDGAPPVQLTNGPDGERDPALSPDGRRIAFLAPSVFPQRLYVMDADGANPRLVHSEQVGPVRSPNWMPDAARLLFYDSGYIYYLNADGSGLQRIPAAYGSQSPLLSPDGTMVALQAASRLVVLALNGSTLTPVSNGQIGLSEAWSPDSRHLLYVNGAGEIVRVDADGGNTIVVSPGLGGAQSASWSSDGQWIVMAAGNPAYLNYQIWGTDRYGQAPQQLTHGQWPCWDVAFRP